MNILDFIDPKAWDGKSGIYLIRNKINGKGYIGQTSNLAKRHREHFWHGRVDYGNKQAIYQAMRKYGVHNFEFVVLEFCLENLLNEYEQKYIKLYNAYGNSGYNMTRGGSNFELNQETIWRRSDAIGIARNGFTYTQAMQLRGKYLSLDVPAYEFARNEGRGRHIVYDILAGRSHVARKQEDVEIIEQARAKVSIYLNNQGRRGARAVITIADANQIRKNYLIDSSCMKSVGKPYGLDHSSVRQVLTGKTYTDSNLETQELISKCSNLRLQLYKKRLSQEERLKLVEMYSTGKYSQVKLAKLFNVSRGLVASLIKLSLIPK